MELANVIRLGDKLLVRIRFFEEVQIEILAWQGSQAFKWMDLMNALRVFKRKSVRLPGHDRIAIMKYTEDKELVERANSTIHRILINPTMLYLIDCDEDIARVLEDKTDLAFLFGEFNVVIREMAIALGRAPGETQNA
jgi:hypothetical protein